MEFKQVIKTCLNFSIANGGTIQSYTINTSHKLAIHSRTTRTEILVEMIKPGEWQVEHEQNAAGDKISVKETVFTEEQLLENIKRFWDPVRSEQTPSTFTTPTSGAQTHN